MWSTFDQLSPKSPTKISPTIEGTTAQQPNGMNPKAFPLRSPRRRTMAQKSWGKHRPLPWGRWFNQPTMDARWCFHHSEGCFPKIDGLTNKKPTTNQQQANNYWPTTMFSMSLLHRTWRTCQPTTQPTSQPSNQWRHAMEHRGFIVGDFSALFLPVPAETKCWDDPSKWIDVWIDSRTHMRL